MKLHFRVICKNLWVILIIVIFTGVTPTESYAFRSQFYEIEKPKIGYDFSYEFDNEKRTGTTREDDNVTETYTESLDIKTGGWLLYDRLVTYNLRLSPEWEQLRMHSDNELENESKNAVLAYFAQMTLLPYKPYTFDLYAGRSRSTFTTTFAEKSKAENDSYGATVNLKYNILPTMFKYRHDESTQTGFFSSENESNKYNLVVNHDKFLGESELSVSYSDVSTSFRNITNETESLSAIFRNDYSFNTDVKLASRQNYSSSKAGGFTTSRFSLSEALDWKHKKDLKTHYSLRYAKTDFETFSDESTELGFDLSTRLFEKLAASYFISGASSKSAGLEVRNYGTGLGLGYSKEIPQGKLNISTSHSYNMSASDVESELDLIRDESVILTTGPGTELLRKNIVIDSIEVTDASGTITYNKDVDYSVRKIGSRTLISRVSGSVIGDGDTVLVDYTNLTNATYDFSTFSESYTIDLTLWSALRLSYGYSHSVQRFLAGTEPDNLQDDSSHSARAELSWKWSRTTVDYQYMDRSDLPSESLKISETFTFTPHRTVFFSLSGSYGKSRFIETDEINRIYKVTSRLQWFPRRSINYSVDGFFTEQDGEIVKTRETGISSQLRLSIGIFDVSAEYRFGNSLDRESGEERTNNLILFKIGAPMS